MSLFFQAFLLHLLLLLLKRYRLVLSQVSRGSLIASVICTFDGTSDQYGYDSRPS